MDVCLEFSWDLNNVFFTAIQRDDRSFEELPRLDGGFFGIPFS